jgi:hypothetical protein
MIQAAVRGFLARKKFPELKDQLQTEKQVHAAILIQVFYPHFQILALQVMKF